MRIEFVTAKPSTAGVARDLGHTLQYASSYKENGMRITDQNSFKTWLPLVEFSKTHFHVNLLLYGHALHALREGNCVSRDSWERKKFLFLVHYGDMKISLGEKGLISLYDQHVRDNVSKISSSPCIMEANMTRGTYAPWVPTNEDLLAEDWAIGVTDDKS